MAYVSFKEITFNIDTDEDSYTTSRINTRHLKEGTFFITNTSVTTDYNVKIQVSGDGANWADDNDGEVLRGSGTPAVYSTIALAPLCFAKYYRLYLEAQEVDPSSEIVAAVKFVYQVQ